MASMLTRSPETELDTRVAAVRRFNRFYTRQIGLLRDGYLESAFSLTAARVLYELAHHPALSAAELARDLNLDPGYLSRLLRGFERQRLLVRKPSSSDGRRSLLALTRHGQSVFAPIETRSRDEVGVMLKTLVPTDQARLVGAMQIIESLL